MSSRLAEPYRGFPRHKRGLAQRARYMPKQSYQCASGGSSDVHRGRALRRSTSWLGGLAVPPIAAIRIATLNQHLKPERKDR